MYCTFEHAKKSMTSQEFFGNCQSLQDDVNEKLSKNVKSGSFFIKYVSDLIWNKLFLEISKTSLGHKNNFFTFRTFFSAGTLLKTVLRGAAGTMKVHLFLILSVWSCAKRCRVDGQMMGSPRFIPGMNQNRS